MAYLGNQPVVGDSTNTFKVLDDISTFTLTFDASSSDVVSVANDTLSIGQHRFITGQKVTYSDGGGTAITGLTDGTSYFIIKEDQTSIKLATSASNATSATAIDLTGLGAGTSHTLNVKFDGTNTKFKATHSTGTKSKITRPAQLSLSVNGVIQHPSTDYTIESDSTIVFSTAPVATDKVFGSFIGEVASVFDLEDNTIDEFSGDGSTTTFNLSKVPPSRRDVMVTLDGVVQYPDTSSTTRAYSVAGSQLIFTSAPADGVVIQVRHIGFAGASSASVTSFYGREGAVVLRSSDNISVNDITAAGNVSIAGTLTYEDVTNVDSVGLITARNGISVTGGDIKVGSGITLSPDGDVFTVGVSTFNGNVLVGSDGKVGIGTDNPTTILDARGNVQFGDGGGFDMNILGTRHQFSINGSEKVRINSSGQVRMNNAGSPSADLHVGGTNAVLNGYFQTSSSTGAYHKYSLGDSGADLGYLGSARQISSSGQSVGFVMRSEGHIEFCTGGSTERLRIASDGNVLVGSGITLSPDGDGFFTGITTIRSASFGGGVLQETFHNDTSAVSGTHNHDVLTYGMVWNGSTNAGGSFVINIRGDANTTFDSLLGIGKVTTMTIYSANNNASNYMTAFQIDGSAQTIKYSGGSAPSAATGSGVDLYSLTILKTAANTYSVFGNFTNFA